MGKWQTFAGFSSAGLPAQRIPVSLLHRHHAATFKTTLPTPKQNPIFPFLQFPTIKHPFDGVTAAYGE
jgi:hypothetical protein